MSRMPCGCRICWRIACSAPASCRNRRHNPCGHCCAPVSNWFASRPAMSSACSRRWRRPTSSSRLCWPVSSACLEASGRDITKALIAGESDPDKLLTLVHRGVTTPRDKVRAAPWGRVINRHRFLPRLHLRQIDALDAAIREIDDEVDRDLDPFRQAVRLLRTLPEVSDLGAQVIISEIGIDMSRFPTAGHLIAWATERASDCLSCQAALASSFRASRAFAFSRTRSLRTRVRTSFLVSSINILNRLSRSASAIGPCVNVSAGWL